MQLAVGLHFSSAHETSDGLTATPVQEPVLPDCAGVLRWRGLQCISPSPTRQHGTSRDITMPLTAKQELEHGAGLLAPLLEPCGFVFEVESFGGSSGGQTAVGRFACRSRSIQLHHRLGLGFVVYQLDAWYLDHEEYLLALGVADQSRFLWLPKEIGDERYTSLRLDLERFFSEFLTGSAKVFLQAAKQAANGRIAIQTELMVQATGDTRKRQIAREAFRDKRYEDVVTIVASLTMPECLTPSEKMLVKIARHKLGWNEE